jgi:hypothetical protein
MVWNKFGKKKVSFVAERMFWLLWNTENYPYLFNYKFLYFIYVWFI